MLVHLRSRLPRGRRGIFLISVLFLTLVVTMYIAAAVTILPSDLMQSRSGTLRSQARMAAESGVSYAITRLRNNPKWQGDGDGSGDTTATTVNLPDMTVMEDHGNVVGIVRSGSSPGFAQFRIRFNYQTSSGGPAPLGAPTSSAMLLDLGALSLNNLPGGSDTMVPAVNGASPPPTHNPPAAHLVPARSVWLSVEGRAGAGLYGLSPSNINPSVGTGTVSSVVVQTGFRLNPNSTPALDAVAMSSGSFTGSLLPSGTMTLASSVSTTLARIRTDGTLSLSSTGSTNAPNLVSTSAEAYSNTVQGDNAITSNVTKLADGGTGNFYQVGWNKVTQAAPTSPTIKSGTYVVWQDSTVHYYNMSLPAYQTYMANPANAGDAGSTAIGLPSSMSIAQDPTTKAITLTVVGDTNVTTLGSASPDLAIIPRSGVAAGPGAANAVPSNMDSFGPSLGSLGTSFYTAGGTGQYNAQGNLASLMTAALSFFSTNQGYLPTGMAMSGSTEVSSTNYDYSSGVGHNHNSADNSWNDYSSSFLGPLLQAWAAHDPSAASNPDFQTVSGTIGMSTSTGALISNSAGDTLSPANLSFTFAPTNTQQFAVLSAPSNVTIGAGLGGVGGSIVSAGNISILGMGVNLAANPNAQQGVSLYSQGNISIDTFQQTGFNGNSVAGAYRDLALKGVVYSWGGFTATLGDPSLSTWGNMNLQGSIVAYGGNPTGNPGTTNGGTISITAANATLDFDPSYLQNVMNAFPSDIVLERFYWSEQ